MHCLRASRVVDDVHTKMYNTVGVIGYGVRLLNSVGLIEAVEKLEESKSNQLAVHSLFGRRLKRLGYCIMYGRRGEMYFTKKHQGDSEEEEEGHYIVGTQGFKTRSKG